MALHDFYIIGKHNRVPAMTGQQPMSLSYDFSLVTGPAVSDMNLELNVYIMLRKLTLLFLIH